MNKFEKVDPFDVTSRDLKFPILEKANCTINSPAEMYRRQRVISNRQFRLGAYHANLLHSLQSGTHKSGTVVVGSGDFTPWRGLIDELHTKAECFQKIALRTLRNHLENVCEEFDFDVELKMVHTA